MIELWVFYRLCSGMVDRVLGMQILERVAAHDLMHMLQYFPVVGVTGPRQSGKSTLLKAALPQYRYVSFDDPTEVALFAEDPKGYLQQYAHAVIFDEVHHVPEILRYIKLAVDQDRQCYGKFVVTSSNQFLFLDQASESLAGRIGLLTLLPMQHSEIPESLREPSIFQGAYPELVMRSYRFASPWYAAYVDTYLNKDVRQVANITNVLDLQRLIRLLAANTAQLLNYSTYAKDLGVSVNTIKKWISILEASYIIFLLPPFHNNFGKRVIKSPKLYFYDTGLVSYLTGIKNTELFEQGPMAGHLFENHVVAEILKKIKHTTLDATLYFYRSSNAMEIDLIIDSKTKQDYVEIKNGHTFRKKMFDPMLKIMPEGSSGYLVYRGESRTYSPSLEVLNYSDFLTHASPESLSVVDQ